MQQHISEVERDLARRMIQMAELRDQTAHAHMRRVAEVSVRLYNHWAQRRGLPQNEQERQVELLRTAAMLHDIGNVGIPDTVLKKPGKLTPEERALMETHTLIGAATLIGAKTALDDAIYNVTLFHHARWDGLGYPSRANVVRSLGQGARGLNEAQDIRGESIPLFARIVSIAEVFDALLSPRVYREPWPPERVQTTIAADAGTRFDPELVQLFIAHFDEMCRARAMFVDCCGT